MAQYMTPYHSAQWNNQQVNYKWGMSWNRSLFANPHWSFFVNVNRLWFGKENYLPDIQGDLHLNFGRKKAEKVIYLPLAKLHVLRDRLNLYRYRKLRERGQQIVLEGKKEEGDSREIYSILTIRKLLQATPKTINKLHWTLQVVNGRSGQFCCQRLWQLCTATSFL